MAWEVRCSFCFHWHNINSYRPFHPQSWSYCIVFSLWFGFGWDCQRLFAVCFSGSLFSWPFLSGFGLLSSATVVAQVIDLHALLVSEGVAALPNFDVEWVRSSRIIVFDWDLLCKLEESSWGLTHMHDWVSVACHAPGAGIHLKSRLSDEIASGHLFQHGWTSLISLSAFMAVIKSHSCFQTCSNLNFKLMLSFVSFAASSLGACWGCPIHLDRLPLFYYLAFTLNFGLLARSSCFCGCDRAVRLDIFTVGYSSCVHYLPEECLQSVVELCTSDLAPDHCLKHSVEAMLAIEPESMMVFSTEHSKMYLRHRSARPMAGCWPQRSRFAWCLPLLLDRLL